MQRVLHGARQIISEASEPHSLRQELVFCPGGLHRVSTSNPLQQPTYLTRATEKVWAVVKPEVFLFAGKSYGIRGIYNLLFTKSVAMSSLTSLNHSFLLSEMDIIISSCCEDSIKECKCKCPAWCLVNCTTDFSLFPLLT